MERKVTGLNIELEKSQIRWPTPLPLFQHWPSEKNNNESSSSNSLNKASFCVKAPPHHRKEVKATPSGESGPTQVTAKLQTKMPRHVSGLRERLRPEMVDDGTITVPIQVHSNETQTEELPEPTALKPCSAPILPEVTVVKLTRDRATSPISNNNSNEKQFFEELEQITGHIIIQKFITRSEDEFQQLIKIKFPGMKVRETTITHSSGPFLHTHHESYPPSAPVGKGEEEDNKFGQKRNVAGSSLKLPQTTLEESLKSEPELGETKEFENVLQKEARGVEGTQDTTTPTVNNVNNTWKKEESRGSEKEGAASDLEDPVDLVEESDTDDGPSLIEIKEVVMSPFSVSNSQSIPPSKYFEIGGEEVHFPEEEIRLLEKEIVRNESAEDGESEGGGGAKESLRGESVYNSDSVLESKSDPMTMKNVDKDKVESEIEREEEDDDGAASPVSNSVIQSMNYVGGTSDEPEEFPPPGLVVPEPDEVLSTTSKSVATQTDARSSLRRSAVGRDWDSAQSSSNSSTPSLLDIQLRTQKLDVRLRVGGAGKRKGNKKSTTFGEHFQVESEHLDILEVHGTKIKLNQDPVT